MEHLPLALSSIYNRVRSEDSAVGWFKPENLVDFFGDSPRMAVLPPNATFMNGKSHSGKKQGAGSTGGSSPKGALILGAAGVVGLIVAIAVFNAGSPPRTNTTDPALATATSHNPATDPGAADGVTHKDNFGAIHPMDGSQVPTAKVPKKVVADIVSVASLTNEVTAEDAKKFHEGLTELVRQGAASIPAIQEYLDKNLDSNYREVKGADELGYSSLRHALLDTIKQIGGPEGEGAMVHVLETTAEPNEVHELASNLEAQAPGRYRDQILQAAREALALAESGKADIEQGPLHRVFQTYGETYVSPNATVAGGEEHHDNPQPGTPQQGRGQ
ncbi:MAG: hypothetical protein JWO95_1879 [Verrucomicrobiales bacterium]|nr:hypothetical protein [Verrucomicrobiales bacterium]